MSKYKSFFIVFVFLMIFSFLVNYSSPVSAAKVVACLDYEDLTGNLYYTCGSKSSYLDTICGCSNVGTPPPATSSPTLTISVSPTNIIFDSSAVISWSSSNTTSCTASGAWSGNKLTFGSQSTGILRSIGKHIYTLTCAGAGGSVTKSAELFVGSSPDPGQMSARWDCAGPGAPVVHLDWTYGIILDPPASYYRVSRSGTGVIGTPPVTSFSDYSVRENTSYTYEASPDTRYYPMASTSINVGKCPFPPPALSITASQSSVTMSSSSTEYVAVTVDSKNFSSDIELRSKTDTRAEVFLSATSVPKNTKGSSTLTISNPKKDGIVTVTASGTGLDESFKSESVSIYVTVTDPPMTGSLSASSPF
jgi:hypothetical protein